jgi:hypothetical protein
MGTHPFRQLALAAAVSMAAISQASAGGCWSWGMTCGVPGTYIPVVEVPNVAVVSPIYVVNHGPSYAGPAIVTYSGFYNDYRPVAIYPYPVMGYRVGHYPWFGGGRPYVKRAYWYR